MADKLEELVLFDEHELDFSKKTEEDTEPTVEKVEKKLPGKKEVKFLAKKGPKEPEEEEEKILPSDSTPEDEEDEEENPLTTEDLTEKFNSLKELGYLHLPDDYEFENTEAGLERAVEDSQTYRMREAAMSLWNQLPENFKPLLEYALKGGTDISKYKEVFVEGANIDTADLTSEESQRSVIRELYKARGFSDAKIEKDITRIEDSGDLEDEAKEALTELKEIRKSRKADELRRVELSKKEREIKEQEAYSTLRNTIEQTEDFNGYSIPKARRNEVLSSLYRKVVDNEGNSTTDFNNKLNKVVLRDPRLVLVLSDLMSRIEEDEQGNKFFNFSHINKRAESNAAKKLKKSIDVATSSVSKNAGGSADKTTDSTFDWDSVVITN